MYCVQQKWCIFLHNIAAVVFTNNYYVQISNLNMKPYNIMLAEWTKLIRQTNRWHNSNISSEALLIESRIHTSEYSSPPS